MMVPKTAPVNHLDVADAMFAAEANTDIDSDADDAMLSGAIYELPIVS